MEEETFEEAAITYAHKSFIWPLNKQGEKQSIPPGQLIPPGYAKHQKIATKHFRNGAKWQQEQYTSAHTILEYILLNDDGVGIALGYNSREMIEHYFKRINYDIVS